MLEFPLPVGCVQSVQGAELHEHYSALRMVQFCAASKINQLFSLSESEHDLSFAVTLYMQHEQETGL